MAEYATLGAAIVEAESPAEAMERVGFEDVSWTAYHVYTAKEWLTIQKNAGPRPWIGKTAFLSFPFAAWTMTTGRVGPLELWHPIEWLVALTPFA